MTGIDTPPLFHSGLAPLEADADTDATVDASFFALGFPFHLICSIFLPCQPLHPIPEHPLHAIIHRPITSVRLPFFTFRIGESVVRGVARTFPTELEGRVWDSDGRWG